MAFYVDKALECAEKSTARDFKHGAVCVVNGRILSYGINCTQNPHMIRCGNVFVTYQSSIHAEVDAIRKLPDHVNMRKVRLIVVRTGMKMSKPCELCEVVLKALGINKVYYSCDGQLYKWKCSDI